MTTSSKLGELLDWQFACLRTLESLSDIDAGLAIGIPDAAAIAGEITVHDVFAPRIDGRQRVTRRKVGDLVPLES